MFIENVKLDSEMGQKNNRDFFLYDSNSPAPLYPGKVANRSTIENVTVNVRSNENISKVTRGTSSIARRAPGNVLCGLFYLLVARGDPNGFLRAMRKTARSF